SASTGARGSRRDWLFRRRNDSGAPKGEQEPEAVPMHGTVFPFPCLGRRDEGRESTDDHATANRIAMPHLRDALPLAVGGIDELVRRQAHGFSRARRWDAAAAVSDPHLQSVRILWRGPGFHGRCGSVA